MLPWQQGRRPNNEAGNTVTVVTRTPLRKVPSGNTGSKPRIDQGKNRRGKKG